MTPDPPSAERPRLSPQLLSQVRRIEIASRRRVQQGMAGDWHSAFRGRGVEFAEVRPYQPGDDVRSLDWNVSARMGQAYIKQYVEERDLTIFLAVDLSGSLAYGSGAVAKRELAAECAALLALAALRHQDRVGAALLSTGVDLFLPPRRHRHAVLRTVLEILARPARGGTDLEGGLQALMPRLRHRGVLFVLSDFLAPPPARALKMLSLRHDVVLVELVDPHDLQLPAAGPTVLMDAETGQRALVSGRKIQAAHARRVAEERRRLRALATELRLDLLSLRTDAPWIPELMALLQRRRQRRAS